MSSRRAWLVIVALLAIGLTGCATPAPPPPRAPSSTAPSRPHEVHVDGIDPCSLAGPDVTAELGVTSYTTRPKLQIETQSSICQWSNRPATPRLELEVWVVTDKSITDYSSEPGAQPSSVAGFPAIDSEFGVHEPDEACMVRIDVASGQGIWVSFTSDFGKLPGASHELMCRKAHVAAEGVMRALLARTGG